MARKTEEYKKIKLLVSIIPPNKSSLFMDIIEKYEVNYHLKLQGESAISAEMREMLGLNEHHKDILLSFIRENEVKKCILELEDRFSNYKSGGIAFSIPLESIIGKRNYLFLANLGGGKRG